MFNAYYLAPRKQSLWILHPFDISDVFSMFRENIQGNIGPSHVPDVDWKVSYKAWKASNVVIVSWTPFDFPHWSNGKHDIFNFWVFCIPYFDHSISTCWCQCIPKKPKNMSIIIGNDYDVSTCTKHTAQSAKIFLFVHRFRQSRESWFWVKHHFSTNLHD